MIELHEATKTYEQGRRVVNAVRGVSLCVNGGEFVTIMGPSGSGKSTLMHILAGLDRPTSGEVWIDGTQITGYGAAQLSEYRRRRVGFVFQFFNLIPTLTALENVELIAELTGRGQDRGEAARLMAAIGLESRIDHFPSALSGGEQQRVAVARALAKHPDLVLCDEPTGALDLVTGRGVLALLREVNRQRGVTMLLVSHNAAIARMADRVIRMRSGRVVEDVRVPSPVEATELEW